ERDQLVLVLGQELVQLRLEHGPAQHAGSGGGGADGRGPRHDLGGHGPLRAAGRVLADGEVVRHGRALARRHDPGGLPGRLTARTALVPALGARGSRGGGRFKAGHHPGSRMRHLRPLRAEIGTISAVTAPSGPRGASSPTAKSSATGAPSRGGTIPAAFPDASPPGRRSSLPWGPAAPGAAGGSRPGITPGPGCVICAPCAPAEPEGLRPVVSSAVVSLAARSAVARPRGALGPPRRSRAAGVLPAGTAGSSGSGICDLPQCDEPVLRQ